MILACIIKIFLEHNILTHIIVFLSAKPECNEYLELLRRTIIVHKK